MQLLRIALAAATLLASGCLYNGLLTPSFGPEPTPIAERS